MRTLLKWSAVAMVAVVLALAAACGDDDDSSGAASTGASGGSATPAASIATMGIVAPEKANDYGWNQQGVEGAQAAADAAGAR